MTPWLALSAALLTTSLPATPAARSPSEPKRPLLVTVDDLPLLSPELHRGAPEREMITRALLAVLAKHHVPAVAFVIGSHVATPEDRRLVEAWAAAGHELGNHSFSHLDYSRTELEPYRADVEKGRAWLAEMMAPHKRSVRFFRFPFLDEGDTPEKLAALRKYLAESGQRNLPVTIDDQDWSFEEPYVKALRAGDRRARSILSSDYQAMMRQAVRDQEARGDALFGRKVPQVLLLHASAVGNYEWDELLTWLEHTGHRFAGVDEVLADPAFRDAPEFVADHGPGLWDRILDGRRRAAAKEEIAKLLAEQAAAWNRGDIPGFCAAYAEDATFIAPSGLTEGRAAIAERYAKKYDSKEKMGTLTLEVVETRVAAGTEFSSWGDARPGRVHGASTILRWTIAYPGKPSATGLSLVSLRKALRTPPPDPSGHGAEPRRPTPTWMIVQDASM